MQGTTNIEPIQKINRHLHGPGPSDVYPTVLEKIGTPMIGHLDPDFISIMEEVKELLRIVFETDNDFTLPISGTGSAGMEAALYNIIEPGDPVLVCTNGYFGGRMVDMANRCGGEVSEIKVPWGRAIEPQDVLSHLKNNPTKLVCIVQAETSTGVLQPLSEISRITHEHGALLLVDSVTSMGGISVGVDRNNIDICYSATQKCLSCPPGLAPITFSQEAVSKIKNRKSIIQSWYLDLTLLMKYWGGERIYHHTAPISMNYALHEALRLIVTEGLDNCFVRHKENQQDLIAGLEALDLELLVAPEYRLPSLTTVVAPDGVNEERLRSRLLRKYSIEIGGGLGELKGKVFRIGLMGASSRKEAVKRLLNAIEESLLEQDYSVRPGTAEAAVEVD